MKTITVFLLMTTVISAAFGKSLYGEKEDAENAVKNKYKEAEDFLQKVIAAVELEKGKRDEHFEQQTKDTINKKAGEASEKLDKDILETTRSAIARGKPIQAIECITLTGVDGKQLIANTKTNSEKSVDNVLVNKSKKLDFLMAQIVIIREGLEGLKTQSLEKIKEAKKGFDAIIADAKKKVESAIKQLRDLENKINKPQLSDEYSSLRDQIEKKYKEISEALTKGLQKCIA